ncbi:MAG: hypothetical protein WAS21_20265 [Geminicoccaceae bacterium]
MPCPPEGRSTGITTTHHRRRTFSRTAGIRALGVCLCCWVAIGLTWSGEALARPQLIIVNTASDRTGDAASPANVARNMSFIESTGIDGVALNTDAGWNLMQKGKLSYDQVRRELAPLQGKMRQVRTNFVLTYVMNVDPFDSWAGVIDNWVTLARASRDAGMTGFIFDNEPYNGEVWIYPRDVKHAAAYSLADYQKQYRRRGKELMTALTQVWPKLRFLVMHGPYLSDRRTPDHVVLDQGAVTDRDLSGFFFAGLLEAATGPAKVIDGGEVYQYRSRSDFANSYRYRKHTMPALAGGPLIPASLRPLWSSRSDIAFGVFDEQWIPEYPMNLDIFETTLTNALRQADSYVWLYAERHNYLKAGGVGAKWLAAVKRAKVAANAS